jgi:hypothetical protein
LLENRIYFDQDRPTAHAEAISLIPTKIVLSRGFAR